MQTWTLSEMHKVKPCNRSYPCGRSLTGRMRSHVVDALPEAEEAAHSTAKLASFCDYSDDKDEEEVEEDGQVYEDCKDSMVEEAEENTDIELRQHLDSKKKKNKRAEDSSNTKMFVCVKCGKGFQSQKAVCGHMACHSEKDKSLNNPAAHPSKNRPSWFNQRAAMESHSDNETDSAAAGPGTSSRRRSKRVKYKSNEVEPDFSVPNYNGVSSVSVVENEQEEVAKCLMMLSRDSCKWGRFKFKSVGDFSEPSVKMEDRSRSKASGGKIGVRLKPLRAAPDTELAKELRNKTVNDSCISFNESDENSVEANANPPNF
uniref:C2H2-type domain-containing protein n=2 Tax=Kalanchoe fedtschenkoi TaxID=63787 RepID=A0A7N0T5Y5_KALFE